MIQSNQGVAIASRLDNIQTIANQIPNSKWAIWLSSPRADGKMGKIPHAMSDNKLIKIGHDNSSQWVEYGEALKWFNASADEASGLGLLVGSNSKADTSLKFSSGITALDIDNCLDDKRELSDAVRGDVRSVIKLLQSSGIYIEVSPSGRGLRGLWAGNKPPEVGERWKNFGITGELYDGLSTRFVTVTGDVWKDSPVSIVKASDGFISDVIEYLGMDAKGETQTSLARNLDPLTDTQIVAKIKMMAQGKGRRLYVGDMSDYANDQSAADLALCAYIAKLTDSLAQIITVWGLSALGKREKFLTRTDYREHTAQKALDGARASALTSMSKGSLTKARIQEALKAGDTGGLLAKYVDSFEGGKIPKTVGACERILSLDSRLSGAFVWDEFSHQTLKLRSLHDCFGDVVPKDKEPYAGQTWSDSDTSSLTIWLETVWGLPLLPITVNQAVDVAAKRFAINSVVDALKVLRWDGVERLDTMLVKYFNADVPLDTPRYLKAIGRAWMVATVARAFEPGCKHDNVLVLSGGQGMGKSRSIRALACSIAPHAFREGLPPLGQNSEAERSMQGVWLCEMSELAAVSRSSTEMVKSFLSKQVDSYRLPYGVRYGNVGRTCSFSATTNVDQYVKDVAGRRFWGFRVSKPIDIEALEADAKQLWAESVAAYLGGETWYLTDPVALIDAERSQKGRLETGAFDELIADKIIDPLLEGKLGDIVSFRMQASHLWGLVAGGSEVLELCKHSKAFSDALTRSGFEGKKSGGKSMWTIGQDLAAQIRKTT